MPVSEPPKDISVDAANHEVFSKLKDSSNSPFYQRTMKDIFIYAAAIGFHNKRRVPLSKKKGTIPRDTFREDDNALVMALAVADTQDLELAVDLREAYGIAEEYANGGILELKQLIDEAGMADPVKILAAEVMSVSG